MAAVSSLDEAVCKQVLEMFKIECFKEIQVKAILNLLNGKDVVVVQPTGSGKSLIFQCFPLLVDAIRQSKNSSIALVISPLTALMRDQVCYLSSVGVRAAFIGEEQLDEEVKKNVELAHYQIVFGSPESFLSSSRWRSMLTTDTYRERLCLIAVDEAHCIQHWGYSVKKGEQAFRKWFGRINEIRSLVKGVPILALTATATIATRKKIMQSLEMEDAVVFNQNPNRNNISYCVQTITGGANKTFAPYIENLKQNGTASDRVIIYCQTIKVVSHIYGVFLSELGGSMYAKQGDLKSSMVEMYHSRIDELNQETILDDFAKPDGNIRVLISTIAYGMGINCQGVKQIIHYGPSRNIEAYHQESGRAGRDSEVQCTAVILYSNVMLKFCDEAIQAYVHNNIQCRRALLLSHFDAEVCHPVQPSMPHECCDICQRKCRCNGDACSFVYFPSQSSSQQSSVSAVCKERDVTVHQHERLFSKLEYLRKSFAKTILDTVCSKASALFTSPELVSGFSETQVQQALTNCHKIFSIADVHNYVDIWEPCVAVDILVAIQQVFGDTDFVDNDYPEEKEEDVDLLSFYFWGSEQEDEMLQNIPDEFFITAESSDSESDM